MATDTLTLRLTEGTLLDGGPYHNAQITDVDPDGGIVWLSDDTPGDDYAADVDAVADALTSEVNGSEPIHVANLAPADARAPMVTITLPARRGYTLRAYQRGDHPLGFDGSAEAAQEITDRFGGTLSG